MNKNIFDYGYTGDEVMEISAREYMTVRAALDAGIRATQTANYKELTIFVDESGNGIESPLQEDIISGKAIEVTDKKATFSNRNLAISYDANKITPEMILAQEMWLDIHARNVENGVAKTKEQLQNATTDK